MATLSVILYKSKTLKDGTHPIVLRITKDRKRKYISLGYSATIEEWDETNNQFNRKRSNYKQKNKALLKILFRAEEILDGFNGDMIDFTFEQFKEKLIGVKAQKVYPYIETRIEQLKKEGRIKYAHSHRDTRNALKSFHPNELSFSEITPLFLSKFEIHLRNKPCKDTTIGVFMRTLRAIINQAIKERKCPKKDYPFTEYKISKLDMSTKKRAISKESIDKVFTFVPNPNSKQELSMDMFVFSFYSMGMNFKDMALLKWTNIVNGRIVFKRAKTKKSFSIKILPLVQEVLDKYSSNKEYIFPIIEQQHKTTTAIYNRMEAGLKTYNKHLKIIAEQVGINEKLTSYVSRHSWATVLKKKGVSTSLISEMMGHSSEKVTKAYLDSFGNDTLDKANEALLD